MTTEDALTKAGGFGWFQKFLIVTMILSYNGPGLIVYGVAYYELEPPYTCTYTTDNQSPMDALRDPFLPMVDLGDGNTYTKPCNFTTVCLTDDPSLISYKVNTGGEFYLYNWVEQLNLYCTPKAYIGALGACAFLGAAIACFFLPYAGDKFGRFAVYFWSSIFQLPLYILANTTGSLFILYVLTFYLGVALIGRFTCGFVLVTECLCKKD